MRHVYPLLLIMLALAGCRIVTVDPLPQDPRVEVYGLTLSTHFKTPQGASVICDDRTSYVTYSFYYRGALERWTSRLVGERSGHLSDPQTFTRFSPRIIVTGNYVEVTYEVPPRLAPLELAELEPQSIIPQSIIVAPAPASVIGSSSLRLNVRDSAGYSRSYRSNALPVLNRCY